MRLIFLGTPAFAVPTLEAIVRAGHEVLAVLTQPDRPRGRGQLPAASPVKQSALALNLPVYQPERVRRPEAVEFLRGLPCDAMVVVGYGQIIPQSAIDLAPLGIINVHASLLPKYRGAGPIQWAIVNGETRTGVTTMRIDAGLDTGDMLLKAETAIDPNDTAVTLGARLALLGADLLVTTLDGLVQHTITPEKQDGADATVAPLIKKEDGLIDWTQSALAIHNRIRGLQPWPGAQTTFRGQPLHIWKSQVSSANLAPFSDPSLTVGAPIERLPPQPGQFVSLKPLVVTTGNGTLALLEVQLEGRKRIQASDFANGQRLTENESLGDLPV